MTTSTTSIDGVRGRLPARPRQRRVRPRGGSGGRVSLTRLQPRRSARAAESARLEIVCWATNRGFKSHLLRSRGQVSDLRGDGPVRRAHRIRSIPSHSPHPAARRGRHGLALAQALGRRRRRGSRWCDHDRRLQVVASRHNDAKAATDPTAHAEILALRDAAAAIGGWRLSEVTLVVTLEPCPMCAGALVAARLGRLVYGASDPRAGACGTALQPLRDPRLNHELQVNGGVRAEECGALLTSFFAGEAERRLERERACAESPPCRWRPVSSGSGRRRRLMLPPSLRPSRRRPSGRTG